jgi:outer membrane protein assembly factor BamE (lipoprotein component of BamABCDE complex)
MLFGMTAVALALLAGGCSSIKDHRGYLVDPALLDSVSPGIDNQMSVEKTLGRPTFVSQFGEPDWYYVSINTKQAAFSRPRTNSELIVKVTFDKAGNVARVERSGMEHVVFLSPEHDKTPTLGRDRTFLEDLFGNIGTVNAAGAPPGQGAPGGPNGS